jgi:apolipoprotein D and lipocalin family protein
MPFLGVRHYLDNLCSHIPMNSSRSISILLLASVAAFWGCGSSSAYLPVVKSVDIQRYSGDWYEITKLPNSFESGLTCVKASYSIKSNGDIKVVNSGHKIEDPATVKSSTGTAWVPDPAEPTKLKVRFFWPFSGNYWILALDSDYKYVMIGEPSREYLWILSRERSLPPATLQVLITQASSLGFDVTKLERMSQDCR